MIPLFTLLGIATMVGSVVERLKWFNRREADTFAEWEKIGGLVYRAGNYAVVDRMALRHGETNIRNLHRYQVIDNTQSHCETFRDPTKAILCCDSRLLDAAYNHKITFTGVDLRV